MENFDLRVQLLSCVSFLWMGLVSVCNWSSDMKLILCMYSSCSDFPFFCFSVPFLTYYYLFLFNLYVYVYIFFLINLQMEPCRNWCRLTAVDLWNAACHVTYISCKHLHGISLLFTLSLSMFDDSSSCEIPANMLM